MAEKQNLIKLPKIIGMPPDTHVSDRMMHNSMPVLYITPSEPILQMGLTTFKIEPKMEEYNRILKEHGFSVIDEKINFIKVAFVADNFPTDSFTNEYGESFLNKITDVVSQGAGEISQMLGSKDAIGAAKKMGTFLKTTGSIGETVGGGLTKGSETAEGFLKSLEKGGEGSQFFAGAGRMMSRMLAGARIDFPQVWKNSGFTPSYSVTIRLYNPDPGNEYSTRKYIIGPIAALLCLGLPRAGKKGEEANTYNWPFLHKINCPGIFTLDPGYIASVAVIKGGDQQQIGWNQRLSMVDVRLDIGSLFNSMLLEIGAHAKNRPTLRTYLDNLSKTDKVVYNTKTKPFEVTVEEYNKLFPITTIKRQSTTTESDPDTTESRVTSTQTTIANSLQS